MAQPNIYDDNYKLLYTVQKDLDPTDVNAIEDVKIYHYQPQTPNPFVVMGTTITEAHHIEIIAALTAGREIILMAGGPVNPPPFPPK